MNGDYVVINARCEASEEAQLNDEGIWECHPTSIYQWLRIHLLDVAEAGSDESYLGGHHDFSDKKNANKMRVEEDCDRLVNLVCLSRA